MKTTEEFRNNIKKGVEPEKLEQHFISGKDELLVELRGKIKDGGYTISEVVDKMTPGSSAGYHHLSGRRTMPRDGLITIAILLNFSHEETNRLLREFGEGELYPKRKRDYIIIKGITEKKSHEQIMNQLTKASEKLL